MRLRINGKIEETEAKNILDLLQSKDIEPAMVSVELNSKILDRDHYSSVKLQEEDTIELLFFMGGGNGSILVDP